MQYISKSQAETMAWAQQIGRKLSKGQVFALNGNLGAGKTVIAQGLAQGLGVKSVVNSPTFVLMKVYPIKHDRLRNFVHVDTYRISSTDDLLAIGLQDYLSDPASVVVIEWADKIKKILPKQTKQIKIDNQDETTRVINY